MCDIVSKGWDDAIMSQGMQAAVEGGERNPSLVSLEIVELGYPFVSL